MTFYSLYCKIYIYIQIHDSLNTRSFTLPCSFQDHSGRGSIIYIRARLVDKDRPVCTNVITRDECNRRRSIALTPPFSSLPRFRFLSKKFYNFFSLEKFTIRRAHSFRFLEETGLFEKLGLSTSMISDTPAKNVCFINSRFRIDRRLCASCALNASRVHGEETFHASVKRINGDYGS